jgi:hypothetical protein
LPAYAGLLAARGNLPAGRPVFPDLTQRPPKRGEIPPLDADKLPRLKRRAWASSAAC